METREEILKVNKRISTIEKALKSEDLEKSAKQLNLLNRDLKFLTTEDAKGYDNLVASLKDNYNELYITLHEDELDGYENEVDFIEDNLNRDVENILEIANDDETSKDNLNIIYNNYSYNNNICKAIFENPNCPDELQEHLEFRVKAMGVLEIDDANDYINSMFKKIDYQNISEDKNYENMYKAFETIENTSWKEGIIKMIELRDNELSQHISDGFSMEMANNSETHPNELEKLAKHENPHVSGDAIVALSSLAERQYENRDIECDNPFNYNGVIDLNDTSIAKDLLEQMKSDDLDMTLIEKFEENYEYAIKQENNSKEEFGVLDRVKLSTEQLQELALSDDEDVADAAFEALAKKQTSNNALEEVYGQSNQDKDEDEHTSSNKRKHK